MREYNIYIDEITKIPFNKLWFEWWELVNVLNDWYNIEVHDTYEKVWANRIVCAVFKKKLL